MPAQSCARRSRCCTIGSTTTPGLASTSSRAASWCWARGSEPSPTEHTRIPIGAGICGAAAASGRTEIVDDVNADDRYIACFVSTRAEIVVPVIAAGRVVAEIDVDSDTRSAFAAGDQAFLERVAVLISPFCERA